MGPLCRTLGSVCVKDPGGPAGAGETEVAPFTGCLSAHWEATSHGGREDEAVPSPGEATCVGGTKGQGLCIGAQSQGSIRQK